MQRVLELWDVRADARISVMYMAVAAIVGRRSGKKFSEYVEQRIIGQLPFKHATGTYATRALEISLKPLLR